MLPRTAWLLVPLLAVAAWLIMRSRGEPGGSLPTREAPVTTNGTEAPRIGAVTPDDPARGSSRSRRPPQAVASDSAAMGAVPAAASGSPGSASPSAPGAAPRPAAPTRTGSAPASLSDDDAPAGKFTDRTGWGDASVGKQLNKELMPLASECIDQAKARKPRLEGLLAFTMLVAPTENGRVIVASIKARPDNQIEDPELFECIRESSFALEGLRAPHDFDITMPIKPEGAG